MRLDGFTDADIERLESALFQAFTEAMELLGRKFTEAITSPVWRWDDGSTRDIVDKGQLRDSQELVYPKRHVAEFQWNVEYAAAVHEGARLKNGTQLPSRRWTEYAFNNFDVLEVLAVLFEHYSGIRRA